MATTIDWADVRRRVAELAAAPAAAEVFGYLGHRFALEPVLTPDELAELEQQIGVTLPDDYRGFLLHVGAGGAGPAYGVFPVRRTDGRWRWDGDGAELTDPARLAEPFPTTGPDPDALAALRDACPDEEDFADGEGADGEDFDAAYEAWSDRIEAVLWDDARTVGAICLCHLGCALREWLVVSGPERGNIWSDGRADDVDLVPLTRRGSGVSPEDRVTFADWYLTWLADAETKAHPDRPA